MMYIFALLLLLFMIWLVSLPFIWVIRLILLPSKIRRDQESKVGQKRRKKIFESQLRANGTFRPLLPYLINPPTTLGEIRKYELLLREHILAAIEEYNLDPSPRGRRYLQCVIERDIVIN